MLVRSQTELALMYLCDLAQRRFEFTTGLVLHAPILDEASEVVFAVLTDLPAKVVDVTVECKGACGLELKVESIFYLRLERIEAEAINGILQSSVLSTNIELSVGAYNQ